jgi:hypothetical protein
MVFGRVALCYFARLPDSKSGFFGSGGSILALGTIKNSVFGFLPTHEILF